MRERCCEPRVKAEQADTLIWAKVAEALRKPQLLVQEYARQAEQGTDARADERLAQVEKELERVKREQDRNLELYVAGEVNMTWLKERQDKLRIRMAGLQRERDALKQILDRRNGSPDIASFTQFCQLISQRLDTLTFEEKRQVLRLLNIEGRVKDGNIMLTGCIPETEAVPSEGGQFCGYQPTHQHV